MINPADRVIEPEYRFDHIVVNDQDIFQCSNGYKDLELTEDDLQSYFDVPKIIYNVNLQDGWVNVLNRDIDEDGNQTGDMQLSQFDPQIFFE